MPVNRINKHATFTLPPATTARLGRLAERSGETKSAVVDRLINAEFERAEAAHRRYGVGVIRGAEGYHVVRWTPHGLDTLSTHPRKRDADAAAAKANGDS